MTRMRSHGSGPTIVRSRRAGGRADQKATTRTRPRRKGGVLKRSREKGESTNIQDEECGLRVEATPSAEHPPQLGHVRSACAAAPGRFHSRPKSPTQKRSPSRNPPARAARPSHAQRRPAQRRHPYGERSSLAREIVRFTLHRRWQSTAAQSRSLPGRQLPPISAGCAARRVATASSDAHLLAFPLCAPHHAAPSRPVVLVQRRAEEGGA